MHPSIDFPNFVILFASNLAAGLHYATCPGQDMSVFVDCSLTLLPGQSFRFPTVSNAAVTTLVQITFETARHIK
jgi:hypothetical protein